MLLYTVTLIYSLCGGFRLVAPYTVPVPQISVLSPRGVRFEIIDQTPGVSLIAYHYSINKDLSGVAPGEYNVDVPSQGGIFLHENRLVNVRDGDTVHYWVLALYDNGVSALYYQLLDQQWTYKAESTLPQVLPTLPTALHLPTSLFQTLVVATTAASPPPMSSVASQTQPPGCQAPSCYTAYVNPLPSAASSGSFLLSHPTTTVPRPGTPSPGTPATFANNMTAVAPSAAGDGGLSTTTTIVLAVTLSATVVLAVALATFFTLRTKRIVTSHLPSPFSRPSSSMAWAPTKWAATTDPGRTVAGCPYEGAAPSLSAAQAPEGQAELIYEDLDAAITSVSRREAAREGSWPGLRHLSAAEVPSRARIPSPPPQSQEYRSLASPPREAGRSYNTPVED